MKKHFESGDSGYEVGDLLGLGSQSVRKNYYPALQDRLDELERERNRYKWLFENALHGIFQANFRGGILACNPAMARLCGYASPEQLITSVYRLREQLFCRVAEFDAIRLELLNEGSLSARETCFRRADNSPVYVAVTLLRRPDLGPEVVEAFVADITERVQARTRLEQLNAELEKRVEERTAALQQVNADLRYQIEEREKAEHELVIAVEAAKEANRSKDKYLAAASHDLLQPLNAARLMVSALDDSNLPRQESHMVKQATRALDGAEELLADLLDISKLDQQAMKPDAVCICLDEQLSGLAGEFEAVAGNAGLDFRVRLAPVMVKTDLHMLTRILRNLLSNAFRYTFEGGVLMGLRPRGNEVRIEIWDTGVGIERDKLNEIFMEFHQLPLADQGGRQGVGLGLAIVERMAKVLGCRIEVQSRVGRGSVFAITLPRVYPSAQQQQACPEPVLNAVASFAGQTVLVMDNEPAVLESMQILLERWGCRVFPAKSEVAALELLDNMEQPPAAILADYHLDQGIRGSDAVHRIRQCVGKKIPAAIITADRSDATLALLRNEKLPVLNKPVKPNRLRALLNSLLA